MKKIIGIAWVGMMVFLLTPRHSLAQSQKKFQPISISAAAGGHSIGLPFSLRMPFHPAIQLGVKWNRNPARPLRQWITSIGYQNRKDWSNDICLQVMYSPSMNFLNNKFYFSGTMGMGGMVSIHSQKMYVFKDQKYTPAGFNGKVSGLIVLGGELGINIKKSERIIGRLGLASDAKIQVPHGGFAPFLPHTLYQILFTKIILK